MDQMIKCLHRLALCKYTNILWFFILLTLSFDARCDITTHPTSNETLSVQSSNSELSIVSFRKNNELLKIYELPFQVKSISKLIFENSNEFLIGSAPEFEFTSSFSSVSKKVNGTLIGYGFSLSPGGNYLVWVQFYPRHAINPNLGVLRAIKITNIVNIENVSDGYIKDAGSAIFENSSEEILLFPSVVWSQDGKLAFLSQEQSGLINVIACSIKLFKCQKVGSVASPILEKQGKRFVMKSPIKFIRFDANGNIVVESDVDFRTQISKQSFPVKF